MKKLIPIFVFSLIVAVTPVFGQTACAIYNNTWYQYAPDPPNPPNTIPTYTDWTQHGTGDHQAAGYTIGSCLYTGAENSGYCTATCNASTDITTETDWGLIEYAMGHTINVGIAEGTDTADGGGSNAPAPSCGSQWVAGVNSCLLGLFYNFSIGISAGAIATTCPDSPRRIMSHKCRATAVRSDLDFGLVWDIARRLSLSPAPGRLGNAIVA